MTFDSKSAFNNAWLEHSPSKNKIGDLFAASALWARGKLAANKLFAASDHNLFAGFSMIASHSQLNHSLQKLIKFVKVLSCDWAVNKILFIPHSRGIIFHRSTFAGWSQPCDHYSLLICRSKLINFWKYSIRSLIAAQSQLICTLYVHGVIRHFEIIQLSPGLQLVYR